MPRIEVSNSESDCTLRSEISFPVITSTFSVERREESNPCISISSKKRGWTNIFKTTLVASPSLTSTLELLVL